MGAGDVHPDATDTPDGEQLSTAGAALVQGIMRGLYCYAPADMPPESGTEPARQVHLFGSGAIMSEVLQAQELLQARKIPVHVWSVTSYGMLLRDALLCERHNRMHPGQDARVPYVQEALAGARGVFVAACDYMRALPGSISRWIPGPYVVLGTDGYGLSESRQDLRNYFEVSAPWIAHSALSALETAGHLAAGSAEAAAVQWGLDVQQPCALVRAPGKLDVP